MSTIPTKKEAKAKLNDHVSNAYQLHHALMVALALEGYAGKFGEDTNLWYVTGLLHDIDFEEHPSEHPGPSLAWFREWGYPGELIHAVEAHACGYNGFTTEPTTKLAAALIACDELCGIFYAYKQLNPIPYGEMKVSSIKKRLKEQSFAAKIDREVIYKGVDALGVPLDEHIQNVINSLKELD